MEGVEGLPRIEHVLDRTDDVKGKSLSCWFGFVVLM